jgi:hypothetical protein
VARSSAIWLVEYDCYDSHWPVAAFTVKHELVTWLGKQATLENLLVHKMKDGRESWATPGEGMLAAISASELVD